MVCAVCNVRVLCCMCGVLVVILHVYVCVHVYVCAERRHLFLATSCGSAPETTEGLVGRGFLGVPFKKAEGVRDLPVSSLGGTARSSELATNATYSSRFFLSFSNVLSSLNSTRNPVSSNPPSKPGSDFTDLTSSGEGEDPPLCCRRFRGVGIKLGVVGGVIVKGKIIDETEEEET